MTIERPLKLGLLALFVASPVLAGPAVLSLLETTRWKITLPTYTTSEKRLVFDQAKLIINDVYVHKDLKLKDFGANPAPALKVIEDNLETSTDYNFHKSMSDIFTTFRDKHTLYNLPRPYACYNNFLPFNLREVLDDENKLVLAVSSLEINDQIRKLLKKPLSVIQGDVLVSYDGLPVEEAIKKHLPEAFGANDAAARRGAIDALIFKQHDLSFLPEKNSVKLEFKNRFGKIFSQDLPWITRTKWDCLSEASSNKNFPNFNKKKKRKKLLGGEEAEETIFYSKVVSNQYGDFGYLRLSSFSPEVLNADEIILKFKDILKNDFANTDGLIIDVRGNGGGEVTIAERMLQLVSPKRVEPMNKILKVTDANLQWLEHTGPKDQFTLAFYEARQMGEAYTRPLPLIAPMELNNLGQFYFKPVVVFTNSYCYSSCDVLAAQIQDNKLGTIFGEDETTGAGGANVFRLSKWLEDLGTNNGPFEALPAGQDIMFAFRQTIRGGINEGKLVENEGIKSDRILRPTMSDLYNYDADQLKIIGKFLNQQSPSYSSWATLPSDERQDLKADEIAKLLIKWEDASTITFKQNQNLLNTLDVENNKPEGQSFILPINTQKLTSGSLEILGSKANTPAFRKIFHYRVVPTSTLVNAPVALTPDKFAFYTKDVAPEMGWNANGNGLQVGDGALYGDKLHTEASLFITPHNDFILSFLAEVNTEADCDILKVVVISEGQQITILDKLSGTIPLSQYKLDLSAFTGKQIEVRFVFDSDEYIAAQGVSLSNIALGPI